MKKILATTITLLAITQAQAEEFRLTDACKESLESRTIKAEKTWLKSHGETLASSLEADTSLSYWPNRNTVSVQVTVKDPVDGRYVSYSAKVLKTEALECRIPLARQDKHACRFSRHEGPESLNDIPGLKFNVGRTIRPGMPLTELEANQITLFLDHDKTGESSVDELIRTTDDGELSTGTLELADGSTLTYFGAYGGDNPFGIFFVTGTTDIAGTNGDGSVCIK